MCPSPIPPGWTRPYSTTLPSRSQPEPLSPLWVRAVRGSPPSSSSSSGSMTLSRDPSGSTVSTSVICSYNGSENRSGWCRRSRSSSPRASGKTSSTASPTPPRRRSSLPRRPPTLTASSQSCRQGTTPCAGSVAPSLAAGRSSASPLLAPSSRTPRCCCWTRQHRHWTLSPSAWCRRPWTG